MKLKVLPASLFILMIFWLATGCGGGGSTGSSLSSSWLGINSDPGTNTNWQIDIKPSAITVAPEQTISLSVLVKDSYGHPLDAVKVLFASQLGGTFEDATAETVKGWASNRFTAGKQQGTESIIVQTNSSSSSKPLLIQAPAAITPVIQLITSSDSTMAGNAVTVAVGVSNNGISANDLEVRLSSTLKGNFDSESGNTVNGWFTTNFTTDDSIAAIGTITAMVNNSKAEKSLAVVKQKIDTPKLTISVNPDAVFPGQTAAIIVIAKDSSGSVSNANVNFSSSLTGSFNPSDGTPQDGMFFTEFTAGNEIGSAAITVYSVDASASAVLSIEKAQIVMKISPSVNTVKIQEKVPVSVLVTDSFSRPIANAPVYLRAELGCYCQPEEGNTNEDGYLFFDLVASKTAGISKIHALTTSATGTAQITVVGP